MALARVQATGKVVADAVASVAITFATPPTVGNAIVIPVSLFQNAIDISAPTTCVDNRGNTYTRARAKTTNPIGVDVWYCPAVVTSAAPFTITLTRTATLTSMYFGATAIEVSGVGTGLAVDQATSGGAGSGSPTTGTTAALTAAEVLLVAVNGFNSAEASITVETVSPPWFQELEELSFSHAVGEVDSRIVTGATGTTASCSWTIPTTTAWAAVIVAFKASGPAPVTGTGAVTLGAPALAGTGTVTAPAVTGTGGITLGGPALAGSGTVSLPVTTGTGGVTFQRPDLAGAGTVQVVTVGSGGVTFGVPALDGSGGLLVPAQATQLAVETVGPVPHAPLGVSQVVVETADLLPEAPLDATQVAAELLHPPGPNDLVVTQVCYELLILRRPGGGPPITPDPGEPLPLTGCPPISVPI